MKDIRRALEALGWVLLLVAGATVAIYRPGVIGARFDHLATSYGTLSFTLLAMAVLFTRINQCSSRIAGIYAPSIALMGILFLPSLLGELLTLPPLIARGAAIVLGLALIPPALALVTFTVKRTQWADYIYCCTMLVVTHLVAVSACARLFTGELTVSITFAAVSAALYLLYIPLHAAERQQERRLLQVA